MNTFSLLIALFSGGLLVGALATAVEFRFHSMLRSYAFSSLCLAGLAIAIGLTGEHEFLLTIAIGTILFKVIGIPMLLRLAAMRSGAPLRLSSYVRPTPSYFAALGIVLLAMWLATIFPVHSGEGISSLAVSLSLVLLGLFLVVARKDVLSQIVGFLTLENGLSVFAIVSVGSTPLLFEVGVFAVVTIGAVLMATLSQRVLHLYGTSDTTQLRELID